MFEISFEINGRKVHPDRIGDEFEKAMYQAVKEELTNKVGNIRDPITGERPTLTVKGRSWEDLAIEVHGSQALIEEVKRQLG